MRGLDELASAHDVPLHLQGLPMAFHASMPGRAADIETFDELGTTDRVMYETLCALLLAEGIWVARRGVWYLSTAHSMSIRLHPRERRASSFADEPCPGRRLPRDDDRSVHPSQGSATPTFEVTRLGLGTARSAVSTAP